MIEGNFFKTLTSQNPGIDSQSIYFEKLSLDGLNEMHEYSIDERLYEFFEFPPFKEISDTEAYINKLLERMDDSNGIVNSQYWFVRNKSDKSMVGSAGLNSLDYSRKSVEWGYGIDPKLWGKGYVLQIQEALKKFVFEDLSLNRLHGITMISNKRTIESVLASGMLHEGIAKDYYCKDGIFIDGWQYSMIKDDYKKISANISSITSNIKKEEIINVVQSVLSEESISSNSSIENTHTWDSLSHMIIMVNLKEELGVEFNPSEIAEATSISNIYELIKKS